MSTPDLFNLGNMNKTEEDVAEDTSEVVEQKTKTIEEQLGDDSDSETDTSIPQVSELDMLKQRARLMGLTFSNNIGVEALAKKIEEKLAEDAGSDTGEDDIPDAEEEDVDAVDIEVEQAKATAPVTRRTTNTVQKKLTLRQHLLREAKKLVRIRVTCMDPKKRDLPGEIFTVANEYIGTVRKHVPFGEATENGYHVPNCIYEMMRDRKFLQIRVIKKNGREFVSQKWVREFAIEVLPNLTETELARLATAQIAAGTVEVE